MAHSNAPMFGVGEGGKGFFLQGLGHVVVRLCFWAHHHMSFDLWVFDPSSLPVSVPLYA